MHNGQVQTVGVATEISGKRPYARALPSSGAVSARVVAPETKLSSFPETVIGARVAKSGNATPQSGDLEGFSKPVKLGAGGVAAVIDTARP